MAKTQEFSDICSDNMFDIRDVIARYEELETERETLVDAADEASQEPQQATLPDGTHCEWDERLRTVGALQVASDTETEAKEALDEWDASQEGEEFRQIKSFLDDVRGYGGDEQWRGDWYPVTFIGESYFTEYAEDLVKDIGDMPQDIPSYIVIDWEATASNIRQDYSEVEVNGSTWLYR